jgi:hypothetical protein
MALIWMSGAKHLFKNVLFFIINFRIRTFLQDLKRVVFPFVSIFAICIINTYI